MALPDLDVAGERVSGHDYARRAAVSGALLLMCEVLVLDGLIRAAQPSGSNSRIHPVRVTASTATSRCAHDALVKSIVIKPVVDSAVIRCGTVHCPDCLRLGALVLSTRVPGSGRASPVMATECAGRQADLRVLAVQEPGQR